jgi:hypothetical protein
VPQIVQTQALSFKAPYSNFTTHNVSWLNTLRHPSIYIALGIALATADDGGLADGRLSVGREAFSTQLYFFERLSAFFSFLKFLFK